MAHAIIESLPSRQALATYNPTDMNMATRTKTKSIAFASLAEVNGAMEPPTLKQYVGYAIRRAQLRAYQNFFETLAAQETTPARFTLMLLIRENPGIRSVDLARILNVARSGLVKLMDEFDRQELITRETLQSDRRNQAISLTPLGRRRLKQLERAVTEHEASITRKLSAAERQQLLDLLGRVGV
jgi:DNA-binding MarR family transcriptional regulator